MEFEFCSNIDKIRISLNQYCYIVPPVAILDKFFDLEFFYITDGERYFNEVCLIEIKKYNLLKDDMSNLFYVTKKEFCDIIKRDYELHKNRIIYYSTSSNSSVINKMIDPHIINSIMFTCSHGIDEESFLILGRYTESIIDYQIFSAISKITPYELIDKIYNIDKTKKTIMFMDTSFTFGHNFNPHDMQMIACQNRMIDDLIKLKHTYNVIMRFHPQYYHMLMNDGCNNVAKRICENFIVDFTQISLSDLYDKADIIISNRCTSSGYQAIFRLDKPIIMIDMNIDLRKRGKSRNDWLVIEKTNAFIDDLKKKGTILNDDHVVTGYEHELNIFDEVKKIEANNYVVNKNISENRLKFIEHNWNITQDDMNDIHNIYYFLIYVIAQIEGMHNIIETSFDNMEKLHGIPKTKFISIKKALNKRIHNKFKIN